MHGGLPAGLARTLASCAWRPRFLQWLIQREGALKERVFRGSAWLFIGNACARMAGLVKLGLLARLLTPADFGLTGIATLLIRWFELFSQTGLRQALIRTSGDIKPYLNTLWTVQVLRGGVLTLSLFLLAPLAAWFFKHPEVQTIIQALAPLVLLRGFTNPAMVYLTRELDFQRMVQWNMWQVFTGVCVVIPLALRYRSVWALVVSLLAGQAVYTLASYYIHPFRPRFAFDRQLAREMAHFGKWIFGRNILNALVGSLDSFTVGKLLGASALGLYQVASRVATLPGQAMNDVLLRVTFPAYAQLRHPDRLRRAYLQVLEVTLLLTVPTVAILCIFAQAVVHVFLGPQWLTIVTVLQLLAVCGGLRILLDVACPMFEGMGRPDILVKMKWVELPLCVLVLAILTQLWSLTGAAFAIVGVSLLMAGAQYGVLRRFIGLRMTQGLAVLWPGIAASLPIFAVGIGHALFAPPLPIQAGLAGLAGVVCAGVVWVFFRPHLTAARRVETDR